MRMSHWFGRTLREGPADVEIPGLEWLMRAGMVRAVAAGLYTYLPLGWRVVRRLQRMMREEMEALGGLEMVLPLLQPAELWQASGRWQEVTSEGGRWQDPSGRPLVLGGPHEELIATLARQEIRSYRQIPLVVHGFQSQIRNVAASRSGLMRARECITHLAYSLNADEADLQAQYAQFTQRYAAVFERCGLEPLVAEADAGFSGAVLAHIFVLLHERGEETLLICPAGDYAATQAVARTRWPTDEAEMAPLAEVATPEVNTIAKLARFLNIPEHQTSKAMFYQVEGELVFVVVRGDLAIQEAKLARALGTKDFTLASEEAIRAAGAVPGYASPVGLSDRVTVLVDESVVAARNLVAGANKEGFHLQNVNYGRDFSADRVVDIAAVRAGDPCPQCGAPLTQQRGIALARFTQWGTHHGTALGATYADANGQAQPLAMGSYEVDLGRLMAAIAAVHHDEQGLVWPPTVAPADVHLVALGLQNEDVQHAAESIYTALQTEGLEVIYDDRDERAGVKFHDADLIGAPVRVTLGPRSLQQGEIELKKRGGTAAEGVAIVELPAHLRERLRRLV